MIKTKQLLTGLVGAAILLTVTPTAHAASNKKPAGKEAYGNIEKLLKKLTAKQHLSPKQHVQLDIILKPQNESQLSKEIYSVNQPGGNRFQQYDTPTSFREKFGQPAKVTGQFKPYLTKYHLKSHVFNNGLIISVSGTAKNINRAFATNLASAKYHQNPVQFSTKKPKMPATLSKHVLTVLGITNFNTGNSLAKKAKKKASHPVSKYAPSKFINRYHLQPLYDKGLQGQGQTMGIITFAGFHPTDATHFWKSEHIKTKANRLSVKKVASPSLQVSNNKENAAETTLDVEQSGAIAPQANIRVYQGNFNDVGIVNTFATAFDENKAGSLSMSWGLNEYLTHYLSANKLLTPVYGRVMNILMAQGALQGVTTFIASGDSGAYGVGVGGKVGPFQVPNYGVYGSFPSDNPWVTTTGGTTLPYKKNYGHGIKINIEKERAWGGDYMFNTYFKVRSNLLKNFGIFNMVLAGGGGGISHLYNTPQYQENVPGVNTFNAREYLSSLLQPRRNPVLLSGTDYGRNYPDFSADADPLTGYQIYLRGSWQTAGGTSIVAPQFNGVAAVMNSGKGHRTGFWNPQLYSLAQDPTKTPFTVMDSTTNNSNLYYVGQPGKVYNQATGLGTVNIEKLYNNLQ